MEAWGVSARMEGLLLSALCVLLLLSGAYPGVDGAYTYTSQGKRTNLHSLGPNKDTTKVTKVFKYLSVILVMQRQSQSDGEHYVCVYN
jgi:hypothetical protein